jgi:hypothetical protein
MGITLSKRGRVAIKQQGAWGTAETSFAATDFMEVEAPFIVNLEREALQFDSFRPTNADRPTTPGSKTPTEQTFRFMLHGHSTATPSANPTVFPDALLVECALGSGGAQGYNTANLGAGTPADLETTYTDGQGSANWQGYAVSYPTAAARAIAWVKTVTTSGDPDVVDFIDNVRANVTTGTAYGSFVAWLSNEDQLPLTFDYLGSDANSHFRLFDGLPTSINLVFASKQLIAVDVTVRFLDWTNLGTGGAPAGYTYGYPLIPPVLGANGAWSAINGTEFCYATATLSITQELAEVECSGSAQGTSQLKWTDRKVTLELVYTDTDLATLGIGAASAPGDSVGVVQLDLGSNTPGRSLSVLMPNAELAEQPKMQDLGGKVATRVLLRPLFYDGDTGSTAPADTPLRVAWL